MHKGIRRFVGLILAALRDLAPMIAVIAFFQIAVLQQPVPNLLGTAAGLMFVLLGLALFVQGLDMGLFPLGEAMAQAFAKKGVLAALLIFSFALGFGITVAEPELIAVADEAARVAGKAGVIVDTDAGRDAYADGLRLTVALSVGSALVVGVVRIILGWPIQYFIIGGYVLVIGLTAVAPAEIVGIAYDSGGVTTSTITVPLVTALGVGLAHSIRDRNPLIDGFGLIAFASLTPIIFVLLFGIVT